jgi:hypothetical protein
MSKAPEPISAREALRAFWEADSYPILGNEDGRVFQRLMAAAMEKVRAATAAPNDPPEFAIWLTVLRRDKSTDEREDVVEFIHDFFRAEGKRVARAAALDELSALDQELKLRQ